jgi:hypothetical protein
MGIGELNPFHILLIKFVLGSIWHGISLFPENLDKTSPFLRLEQQEDFFFRFCDNGSYCIEPILVFPVESAFLAEERECIK